MRHCIMEGREVNGYRIVKKVGEGTYGKVYKVEKTLSSGDNSRKKLHVKKIYALKEINISKLNQKEKDNVRREQETMKSYEHDNIVAYKESFFEGHCLYIAMEFCDGGTLYDYMGSRKGGLEEQEFIKFLTQIMRGVKFLHDHRVIHRDLKTKNILLTKDGSVKIADFGVARSIDSNESINFSKFVGTVHYMSPEMISENPKYDVKTDIWSVGCTCYEMATGKYAFDGKNLPRIKRSVLNRELHDFNKMKLCKEMKQTILDMLETDPNHRPSASDVLEMLARHSCPYTATDHIPTVPKSFVCENIPGSPVPNVREGPLGRSLREGNSSDSNLQPNSSKRQESSRDRRLGSLSETLDMSGAPSLTSPRLSVSSTESAGETVPRRSKGIKAIIKRYKNQSKQIQLNLAAIFDDYSGLGWVVKILQWCKECSLKETERKAEDLLKERSNLYKYTRRMIRSLKEAEDGIREIEEELRQMEDTCEDDDTSVASSAFMN